MSRMPGYVFTMMCPDRPGILAAMSTALADVGANIVENAQFSDVSTDTFCMRTRYDTTEASADEAARKLDDIGRRFEAVITLRPESRARRALVMVSKYGHCLVDLIARVDSGELGVEIPLVVSNHPDLAPIAEHAGIEFRHVPVTPDKKPAAEAELLDLVRDRDIDLVVLARYMQLLSDDLCDALVGRAINIHHSFLPAFKGAKPYHQAWQRGVKVIGATAHYVTGDLDEGPIIAQGVSEVSHRETVEQFVARGRDIERLTLSAAVGSHADDRVFLLPDARTVILE